MMPLTTRNQNWLNSVEYVVVDVEGDVADQFAVVVVVEVVVVVTNRTYRWHVRVMNHIVPDTLTTDDGRPPPNLDDVNDDDDGDGYWPDNGPTLDSETLADLK